MRQHTRTELPFEQQQRSWQSFLVTSHRSDWLCLTNSNGWGEVCLMEKSGNICMKLRISACLFVIHISGVLWCVNTRVKGCMPVRLTVDLQHSGCFGFAHAVFCDTRVSALVLCSDPYQTQAVVTTDLKSTRPRRWKETVVVREKSRLNSHRTFLLQPFYILPLSERTFLWDSIKYATVLCPKL